MMASVSESQRAEVRRQQVLDAAAQCFRASGFHGASMAEIARTAGMSPGHIYNLFANKDDIISAIVAAHDKFAFGHKAIDRAIDKIDPAITRLCCGRWEIGHCGLFGRADCRFF